MTKSKYSYSLPIVAAGLFLLPRLCVAASITISSATVTQPSSPAGICVALEQTAEEMIAGTENLIVWDGSCATLLEDTCAANPAHGKQLSGSLQAQEELTYKALVLSFTDVDPIPAGQLYCCDFLVHANPGECCQLRIASPGAGDTQGNSVPVSSGPPGELCLEGDAPPPVASATPTATTPEVMFTNMPAVLNASEDDGCTVAVPGTVAWALWAPWSMAVLLLLARRRRGAR